MTGNTGCSPLSSTLLYCIIMLFLFYPLKSRIKDHRGNKGSCLEMQTALFFFLKCKYVRTNLPKKYPKTKCQWLTNQ